MIRRSIAGLIGITAGLGLMAIPADAQQLLEPITAQLSAGATAGLAAGSAVDVLQVRGGNQWLITYDGYSSAWDEVVGVDRIRSRQSHSATPSHGSGGGSGSGILYPSTHWDQTGQNNPMWINPYSVPGY
jgi:hypothetical protein